MAQACRFIDISMPLGADVVIDPSPLRLRIQYSGRPGLARIGCTQRPFGIELVNTAAAAASGGRILERAAVVWARRRRCI